MNWRETEPTKYGCRRWQTLDGMFMLVCSDQCDGIPLKTLWVLYQWKTGSWWPVAEKRSRKVIEKLAKQRLAKLESEE